MERSPTAINLRLETWCCDHALWQHIDKKHLEGCGWPRTCPHPLCDESLNDGLDLRFHFIDKHGLSRTVPKDVKYLGTTIPDVEEDQVFPTKRKAQQNSVEEEQALPIQTEQRRSPLAIARTIFTRPSTEESQSVFVDGCAFTIIKH